MYHLNSIFASVDEDGEYMDTYFDKKEAIAESPVKKAVEGFAIFGDTVEEDFIAGENSSSFYYTREEAQPCLDLLNSNPENVFSRKKLTISC